MLKRLLPIHWWPNRGHVALVLPQASRRGRAHSRVYNALGDRLSRVQHTLLVGTSYYSVFHAQFGRLKHVVTLLDPIFSAQQMPWVVIWRCSTRLQLQHDDSQETARPLRACADVARSPTVCVQSKSRQMWDAPRLSGTRRGDAAPFHSHPGRGTPLRNRHRVGDTPRPVGVCYI